MPIVNRRVGNLLLPIILLFVFPVQSIARFRLAFCAVDEFLLLIGLWRLC